MGNLIHLPHRAQRLRVVHHPRVGEALHGIADELTAIADRAGAAAAEIRAIVTRMEALADRALREDRS